MISTISFSLTNLDTVSWESPLLLVTTRKEQGKLLAYIMHTICYLLLANERRNMVVNSHHEELDKKSLNSS